MDSAWCYQYDKYTDNYCYIPSCSHTAGIMARSDQERDAWFSPAGFNRGQLLGITKLSFNPNQSERDALYKKRVNPLVTFPGQGTVLFGDKTLLSSASAFDRINVRRLFIVMEKAIATAAKFQLFEFNDAFTRAQFRATISQLNRDDSIIATYELYNMYPQTVAQIDLSYDTADEIQTFDVTFSYSHWERTL